MVFGSLGAIHPTTTLSTPSAFNVQAHTVRASAYHNRHACIIVCLWRCLIRCVLSVGFGWGLLFGALPTHYQAALCLAIGYRTHTAAMVTWVCQQNISSICRPHSCHIRCKNDSGCGLHCKSVCICVCLYVYMYVGMWVGFSTRRYLLGLGDIDHL